MAAVFARDYAEARGGFFAAAAARGLKAESALLADDDLARRIDAGRVAVLLVHAVNPYGFSHLRRANEDHIDLNRNFLDFSRPLSKNAGYGELHGELLPTELAADRCQS